MVTIFKTVAISLKTQIPKLWNIENVIWIMPQQHWKIDCQKQIANWLEHILATVIVYAKRMHLCERNIKNDSGFYGDVELIAHR